MRVPDCLWRRPLERFDRLSRWAIVACMSAMIVVVAVQVLLRYGFSSSLDWAEETSRLAFVWAVFLAIPHGVRRAAHVGVDVLTRHLPPLLRRALRTLLALASALLMGVVAWQAVLAARETWDQMMPTLELSSGWFYVALATGTGHACLHLLAQVVQGRPRHPVEVELAQ